MRPYVFSGIRELSLGALICAYLVAFFRSELSIAAAGIGMGLWLGLRIDRETSGQHQ
jgi:hypothetical protein